MFDIKKSSIYPAVRWQKLFALIKIFKKVCLLGFFVSLPLFFLTQEREISNPFILLLVLFVFCQILVIFFETKLKKPKIKNKIDLALANPDELNLAEFLGFEPALAVSEALGLNKLTRRPEIDSCLVAHFLLKDNPELKFIFERALLDMEAIKEGLKQEAKTLGDINVEEIITSCLRIAQEKGHQKIAKGDLLIYLAKYNPIFKEILVAHNLYSYDIENLVWWLENLEEENEKKNRFWDYENLIQLGSLGKDWSAGYTVNLDEFSVDWTGVVAKRGFEKIIGHKNELDKLERILTRQENNSVLLIGEPGCGRKSVVHMLTKKILLGQSSPALNYKRVVELDLLSLVARAKTQRQVDALLEIIFQEVVESKNVVLIIDELPNFISSSKKAGTVDISAMLYKYLRFPDFRVIGICDFSGFRQRLEKNLSLSSLFEKITTEEISEEETIMVLEGILPYHEKRTKKFISYPALYNLVRYCAKYVANAPFPKKAIDLLDEVVVYVSRYTKSQVILPEHVAKIVSEKTKIPVGDMEMVEKERLLNLEDLIHQRIINQSEAVNEISEAMRRARAEITIRKGPIGTFLFMGPTGVGKTETAKALTEIYFGDEKRMIRLDMSEFQKQEDISRLIGSNEYEGLLITKVREAPFSLILLDEIEKAHPDILNLFLQVLDEGFLTDGFGRKTDFKNSIIIATSNAGYKIILEALEKELDWRIVKKQLLDYVFAETIFRPEFINRFDGVVVFAPLSRENLFDISQLMLKSLADNLAAKHIELEITQDLKEKIVELGYNPVFGAREMRRVIQDKIENVLARALLSGQIARGDKIRITPDFEIMKL